MKTPKFWNKNGILATMLSPLGAIYGMVTQWRIKHHEPYRAGVKVICVGNITAGGVGKTPVAIALAKKYQQEGKKVFFVTRGYKGKLKNICVDLARHTPEETGDEARLLAQTAPTIIAPQREVGAKMAVKMGAELIIMDDGFQNPGLYKDESWLVFDGTVGIGNGKIIPAGPLREILETGEKRANRILIMGEDKTGLALKCHLPVYMGRLEAEDFELANSRVLAFAGIGHPEKFYQTLSKLGYEVVLTQDFEDHHRYTEAEIEALRQKAEAQGLALVTTEKDFVKLTSQMQEGVRCLRVRAVIEGEGLW